MLPTENEERNALQRGDPEEFALEAVKKDGEPMITDSFARNELQGNELCEPEAVDSAVGSFHEADVTSHQFPAVLPDSARHQDNLIEDMPLMQSSVPENHVPMHVSCKAGSTPPSILTGDGRATIRYSPSKVPVQTSSSLDTGILSSSISAPTVGASCMLHAAMVAGPSNALLLGANGVQDQEGLHVGEGCVRSSQTPTLSCLNDVVQSRTNSVATLYNMMLPASIRNSPNMLSPAPCSPGMHNDGTTPASTAKSKTRTGFIVPRSRSFDSLLLDYAQQGISRKNSGFLQNDYGYSLRLPGKTNAANRDISEPLSGTSSRSFRLNRVNAGLESKTSRPDVGNEPVPAVSREQWPGLKSAQPSGADSFKSQVFTEQLEQIKKAGAELLKESGSVSVDVFCGPTAHAGVGSTPSMFDPFVDPGYWLEVFRSEAKTESGRMVEVDRASSAKRRLSWKSLTPDMAPVRVCVMGTETEDLASNRKISRGTQTDPLCRGVQTDLDYCPGDEGSLCEPVDVDTTGLAPSQTPNPREPRGRLQKAVRDNPYYVSKAGTVEHDTNETIGPHESSEQRSPKPSTEILAFSPDAVYRIYSSEYHSGAGPSSAPPSASVTQLRPPTMVADKRNPMEKTMKKAISEFAPAPKAFIPSKYCHICRRSGAKTDNMCCGRIVVGCRKVVCKACFIRYSWDWKDAVARNAPLGYNCVHGTWDYERDFSAIEHTLWQCCHCREECPKNAACVYYVKVNAGRAAAKNAAQIATALAELSERTTGDAPRCPQIYEDSSSAMVLNQALDAQNVRASQGSDEQQQQQHQRVPMPGLKLRESSGGRHKSVRASTAGEDLLRRASSSGDGGLATREPPVPSSGSQRRRMAADQSDAASEHSARRATPYTGPSVPTIPTGAYASCIESGQETDDIASPKSGCHKAPLRKRKHNILSIRSPSMQPNKPKVVHRGSETGNPGDNKENIAESAEVEKSESSGESQRPSDAGSASQSQKSRPHTSSMR